MVTTLEINNQFVKENKGKRFNVTFENGTVLKNIKFFETSYNTIGYLSGKQKRYGKIFPIHDQISKIVEVVRHEPTIIGNAKSILKKIHPNAWVELQKEMNNVINGNEINSDFEFHFVGKLQFKNITQYLNPEQILSLKNAFENKTEFKWSQYTNHHRGRDLSINCHVGEDGNFRGFFNSEYMGCGNGDYWLLLNPTTAIFYETD